MIESVQLRCFPSCTPGARLGVVIRLARAKVVEGLSLADSLRGAAADVEEFLGAEHVVASQLELRGETKGLWAWADEPGRTPEQVVEVLARAIVRAKNNVREPTPAELARQAIPVEFRQVAP